MDGAKEVIEAIGGLRSDLDERHVQNATALGITNGKVDEAIRSLNELRRAFPHDDPDGHRRYHEAIIRKNEAREQFYQELRSELAKKGLWALAGLLGLALWAYVKTKLIS